MAGSWVIDRGPTGFPPLVFSSRLLLGRRLGDEALRLMLPLLLSLGGANQLEMDPFVIPFLPEEIDSGPEVVIVQNAPSREDPMAVDEILAVWGGDTRIDMDARVNGRRLLHPFTGKPWPMIDHNLERIDLHPGCGPWHEKEENRDYLGRLCLNKAGEKLPPWTANVLQENIKLHALDQPFSPVQPFIPHLFDAATGEMPLGVPLKCYRAYRDTMEPVVEDELIGKYIIVDAAKKEAMDVLIAKELEQDHLYFPGAGACGDGVDVNHQRLYDKTIHREMFSDRLRVMYPLSKGQPRPAWMSHAEFEDIQEAWKIEDSALGWAGITASKPSDDVSQLSAPTVGLGVVWPTASRVTEFSRLYCEELSHGSDELVPYAECPEGFGAVDGMSTWTFMFQPPENDGRETFPVAGFVSPGLFSVRVTGPNDWDVTRIVAVPVTVDWEREEDDDEVPSIVYV